MKDRNLGTRRLFLGVACMMLFVGLASDYNPAPLNIIDNGHTIQVNHPAGSTLTVGDKTFTLKQFHFHHPSEEHVKGRVYNMVVHLVYTDGKAVWRWSRLFEEGQFQ